MYFVYYRYFKDSDSEQKSHRNAYLHTCISGLKSIDINFIPCNKRVKTFRLRSLVFEI